MCVGMYGWNFNYIVIVPALLAAVGYAFLLLSATEKKGCAALGAYAAIFCILALILWQVLSEGIKSCWNQTAQVLSGRYGMIFPVWDAEDSWEALATAFLLFGILLLALIAVYFKNRLMPVIWFFAACAMQVCLGNRISGLCLLLFTGAALTLAAKKGVRQGYIQCACILLIPLLLIGCLLPENIKAAPVKRVQELLSAACEYIRYGGDMLPSGGDFTQLNGFQPSEETALEVTMEEPASIYLRGFVGKDYSGHGWSDDDGTGSAAYADLFYWLHRSGFYGQGQLSAAGDACNLTEETSTVTVENTGTSRKYLYLPYEYRAQGVTMKTENSIGDAGVRGSGFFGTEEYTFTMSQGVLSEYPSIVEKVSSFGEETEDYREAEAAYNTYVYEEYTQIPQEYGDLISSCLGAEDTDTENGTHTGYQEAEEIILEYLSSEITYDEEAVFDSDTFLQDFLQTEQKGYSVHYATAAVLMLRSMGIPARYVEGYLITPEDVSGTSPGDKISVSGTRAHAWAEYYRDGAGWIPFEVTPPYIGLMEEAEFTVKEDTMQTDTQTPREQMKQDNYEEEDQTDSPDYRLEQLMSLLALLLVLAAAALALLYLIRAKLICSRRKRFLRSANCGRGLQAEFICLMRVLFQYVTPEKNQQLGAYREAFLPFEEGEKECYEEILRLYQKARFSDEQCLPQERETVMKYRIHIQAMIYRSCNIRQKLLWRFWRFTGDHRLPAGGR